MAGITPLEGQDYIADLVYEQTLVAQALTLGLFTNTAGILTESSVWANINEPTGTGYAEITLTAATWTIASGGVATYPLQVWTATADWNLPVYGYYLRTGEGTPRLLHFEYKGAGPRTMSAGNKYSVDLSTDTESA